MRREAAPAGCGPRLRNSTASTISPSHARRLLVALPGVVEGGGAVLGGVTGDGGTLRLPAPEQRACVAAASAKESAAANISAVRHRWPSIREETNQSLVYALLRACSNLNARNP